LPEIVWIKSLWNWACRTIDISWI